MLGLFRGTCTEVRAAAPGDDLLRILCSMLGLRRYGKAECEQLRTELLELAARGSLRLEFEPGDSNRIVAATLPVQDKRDAEIARLQEETSRLLGQVGELNGKIAADASTVETAEELIAMAETARGGAEGALEALQRQFNRLSEELKAAERLIEVSKGKAVRNAEVVDGLRAQLGEARHTIEVLEGRLAPAANVQTTAAAHISADPGAVQDMSCGCKVRRVATGECGVPRGPDDPLHPYLTVVTVPNSNALGLAAAMKAGVRLPKKD